MFTSKIFKLQINVEINEPLMIQRRRYEVIIILGRESILLLVFNNQIF